MDDMTKFFGNAISIYTTRQAIADGVLTEFPHSKNFLFAPHAMERVQEMAVERNLDIDEVMGPIIIDAQMAFQKYFDQTGDYLLCEGTFVQESGWWVALNDIKGLTIMLPADN